MKEMENQKKKDLNQVQEKKILKKLEKKDK